MTMNNKEYQEDRKLAKYSLMESGWSEEKAEAFIKALESISKTMNPEKWEKLLNGDM